MAEARDRGARKAEKVAEKEMRKTAETPWPRGRAALSAATATIKEGVPMPLANARWTT